MKERKSSRKNNIQERMDREKCRWKDKEKIQESLMFLTLNVNVVCNNGDYHFLQKQYNKKNERRKRGEKWIQRKEASLEKRSLSPTTSNKHLEL